MFLDFQNQRLLVILNHLESIVDTGEVARLELDIYDHTNSPDNDTFIFGFQECCLQKRALRSVEPAI